MADTMPAAGEFNLLSAINPFPKKIGPVGKGVALPLWLGGGTALLGLGIFSKVLAAGGGVGASLLAPLAMGASALTVTPAAAIGAGVLGLGGIAYGVAKSDNKIKALFNNLHPFGANGRAGSLLAQLTMGSLIGATVASGGITAFPGILGSFLQGAWLDAPATILENALA